MSPQKGMLHGVSWFVYEYKTVHSQARNSDKWREWIFASPISCGVSKFSLRKCIPRVILPRSMTVHELHSTVSDTPLPTRVCRVEHVFKKDMQILNISGKETYVISIFCQMPSDI